MNHRGSPATTSGQEVTRAMPRVRPLARVAALALLPALLPVVSHAQPFEGVITMRMSARSPQGPPPQESEILVRSGRMRLQMKSAPGGVAVITVPREKKAYALISATKSYTEMSIEPSAEQAAAAARQQEQVKVTRTGRKETIAGFACEHVTVTSASGTADVCVTTELSMPFNPMDPMARGPAAPWQQAVGDRAFPLKLTLADGSVPLEVIAVERKRLAPELFSVPADYKKMTLPNTRGAPPRPPAH